MFEEATYYFKLFLTLCGDIVSSDISMAALLIVVFSTGVVIYAFYQAIICTIWPGETSSAHIKRKVLED
jgi:hypothetical protein